MSEGSPTGPELAAVVRRALLANWRLYLGHGPETAPARGRLEVVLLSIARLRWLESIFDAAGADPEHVEFALDLGLLERR